MKRTLAVFVLVSAALAFGEGGWLRPGAASRPGRGTPQKVTPAADHHTHLYSGAAAAVYVQEPLPSVTLPPELDRVLRDYERFQSAGDAAGIASLFAEDGLFPGQSGWIRGREAIRKLNFTSADFRLRATAYSVEGSVGYIAGFIGRPGDTGVTDIARLVLALRRGPDGRWLIAARLGEGFRPPDTTPRTADRLVAELDAAGVKRAAVLSVAFWFGDPSVKVADEYAKVRAENDWVAGQVARYPDRLVGFCSFNPLKDYALEELGRCAKSPNLKGVKLHFDNSGVDLLNPRHVERIRRIFRAADDRRLPIIVHLWVRGGKYGRPYSEVFLNRIIPEAPDVPVQIAHMAASGPNYHADDAMEVYASAAAAGDPRMRNVYVDVAGMVTASSRPESLELVARRLRQFGLGHVLFGSDYSPGGSNESPKNAWESFLRLPLGEDEFRRIAGNVAPYMR